MFANWLPVSFGLLAFGPKLMLSASPQPGCCPLLFQLMYTPVLYVCEPRTKLTVSVNAYVFPSLRQFAWNGAKLHVPMPQLKVGNRLRVFWFGNSSWNWNPRAVRS